jgi:chitodextrinase
MRKIYSMKSVMLSSLALFCVNTFAQTKQDAEKIISANNTGTLHQLENAFEQEFAQNRIKIDNYVVQMNVPKRYADSKGTVYELQKIESDGTPIYYQTYNVAAARSTRTNFLHTGGGLGLNLMGMNMTAHVWDGGHARVSHQEYDGAGGTNRVTLMDTSSEGGTQLNFHAAHVTGTIVASGVTANAKGMAPHGKVNGYMWNNDLSEATSAAANGMLVSNHSYGYQSINPNTGAMVLPSYYPGAYITDSRDWDQIMYNAPYYLMVVAAGNDGQYPITNSPLDGMTGYDKLTGHATSKNNLVVANANDATIDSNGNLTSVSIATSSSQGPTDDYRIKPDIAGNGVGVYSTYQNSDTSYASLTGTSMASPNVTGTLLILQEHAKNVTGNFYRAATIKGIALHTADDAGASGPDAVFGWGLLNAKKAAETITNNGTSSMVQEMTLTSGQTITMTVNSNGTTPLFASISWTDPAGTATTSLNNTTPKLVNDLDLRVSQGSTTHLPWRLTGVTTNGKGDNIRDPFERVEVAGASGTYTITITHKGSLSSGSQNFSLVVTGISAAPVECTATVPTGLAVSNVTSTGANVNWTAVPGATYDVQYKATSASTWTTVAVSSNSYTISGLAATTAYEVQVRSKCPSGSNSAYSSPVNFTTPETQLSYCASQGNSVADEYISRVQLNTINNASGAAGYSNFTNISTNLTQNQAYTITITPTWTGSTYPEGYAVWIDYNKNGTFDSNELVYSRAASTATPVSGSFTVPTTALEGATRMRVSMKYNGIPTACETFSYGEVEDYTVVIGAAVGDTQPPSAPTNLTASNIAQTTLTLNWTASTDNVGVVGYDVYMNGSSIGTVTSTSANVTGLTAATTYSFYVRAKDAAGNMSSNSNTINVTTLSNSVSYCTSKGNSVTDEYINRVQLNTINNLSGSNGGYGNFTSLSTNLNKSTSYTITITPAWTGTRYSEGYAVWIDYNQNGTFDANERVFSRAATTVTPVSGTFLVPASALSGATRMRVSMKYNGIPTACETFSYGEVEDYTIVIGTGGNSTYAMPDEFATNSMKLYPNPVRDVLNIETDAEIKSYQVFDLAGKVVLSSATSADKINVSQLSSGVYVLVMETDRGRLMERFIKK